MTQVKSLEWKAPYIAPQGPEIAAIEAAMQDPKITNDKQMARKVMSVALDMLTRRNWYVVGQQSTLGVTLWGLFHTETAAAKALETNSLGILVEDGDRVGVFEVRSLAQRDEVLREEWAVQRHGCAEPGCGHVQMAHAFPRSGTDGCVVERCKCPGFREPDYDLPPIAAA